jgi:hypothetical protein
MVCERERKGQYNFEEKRKERKREKKERKT